MKGRKKVISISLIAGVVILCCISIESYLKMGLTLFPTHIEKIECNWKVKLPRPDKNTLIGSTRGRFHGDGEEVNELIYNDKEDLEYLNNSFQWFGYEEIPFKMTYDVVTLLSPIDEKNKKKFNEKVENPRPMINGLNKSAKYFYLKKANENKDIIIFVLKDNKLTIYESYM
ncbi:hypothetical protein [Clostridium sp.]|uniref:hypothetical protein n=1 Tax=Clostridium sp. TaxID=1506 RepID=UPI003216F6C5